MYGFKSILKIILICSYKYIDTIKIAPHDFENERYVYLNILAKIIYMNTVEKYNPYRKFISCGNR